jgi:hypothetical protein
MAEGVYRPPLCLNSVSYEYAEVRERLCTFAEVLGSAGSRMVVRPAWLTENYTKALQWANYWERLVECIEDEEEDDEQDEHDEEEEHGHTADLDARDHARAELCSASSAQARKRSLAEPLPPRASTKMSSSSSSSSSSSLSSSSSSSASASSPMSGKRARHQQGGEEHAAGTTPNTDESARALLERCCAQVTQERGVRPPLCMVLLARARHLLLRTLLQNPLSPANLLLRTMVCVLHLGCFRQLMWD